MSYKVYDTYNNNMYNNNNNAQVFIMYNTYNV